MERKFATTLMICTALIMGNAAYALDTDEPVEKIETERIENTTPQTYDNISIKNQTSQNYGGGFKNTAIGTTSITNSEISANSAQHGGGIYNSTGTLNITNTEISGNSADKGGAIYNEGTVNLDSVTQAKGIGSAVNDIYNEGTINAKASNDFLGDIKNAFSGIFNFIGGSNKINGTLTNEGTLDLQSASKIIGSGSIVNNAEMTLASDVSGFEGTYSQNSNAITTVLNKFFKGKQEINNGTINWQTTQDQGTGNTLTMTSGSLNIGSAIATAADDTAIDGSFDVTTENQITKGAEVNINSTGELNVKEGGSATLNQGAPSGNDTINGNMNVEGGKLTLENVTTRIGSLNATSGEVEFKQGSIIQANDLISSGVKIDIETGSTTPMTGGNVTASDNQSGWEGTLNQTGGDLTLENVTNRTGVLVSNGGNLVLDGTNVIKTNDSVSSKTALTLGADDILNLTGGSLNLDNINASDTQKDTWQGKINQTGGVLVVDSFRESHGNLVSNGGELTFKGNNTLTNGDEIGKTANTKLVFDTNSTTTIQGTADINVNSDDVINGTISQTGAKLAIDGATRGQNSVLTSTGGELNLKNTSIQGTDNISKNTKVNVTGTLEIDGGSVTLDSQDDLSGNVKLDSGKLTLDNISADRNGAKDGTGGAIVATGGNLDIKGNFNVNNASDDIQKGATVNIVSGTTTISAGKMTLDTNDTITGNVVQSDGTLILDNLNQNKIGSIKSTGGSLALVGENVLNNSADSIASNTSLNIQNSATLDIQKGTVSLDGENDTNIKKDTWLGTVKTGENAALNINNVTSNGKLIAQDGIVNVSNSSLTLSSGSSINSAADTTFTNSNLTINGGSAEFGANDSLDTNITMSLGSLALNSISKTADKTLKTTGGTLSITGTVELNNANDYLKDTAILNIGVKNPDNSVTDGKVVINNGQVDINSNDNWLGTLEVHNNGVLKVANGNKGNGKIIADNGTIQVYNGTTLEVANGSSITDEVKTTLNGNLNITGGSVELNQNSTNPAIQNDTVSGTISMSNGTLSLDNVNVRSGKLNLTGGILKVLGSLTKIKNGDTISDTQIVTGANDTLNIEGGSVEVKGDNKTNWLGKLAQIGGILTLDNAAKTGALTSNGGTLNIKGTLDLSNAQDNISKNSTVSIAQDAILNVKNGSVTLNKGTGADDWKGSVNVSNNGEVTIKDFNKTDTHGALNAQNGSLNFENSKFQIDSNTLIAENAVVSIDKNSTLTVISGGDLTLNNLADGTKQDDWQGAVVLNGGNVTVKNMDSMGSLSGDTGNLDIINSNLTFDSNSKIADEVNIDFDSNSIITIDGAQLTLDKTGDNWQGEVNLKSGKLTVSGFNNDTGSLRSEAGELYLKNSNLEITGESTIADNTTLSIDKDSTLSIKDSLNASLADKGGAVTLNQNSVWEGKVNLNGTESNLTLNSVNAKRTGILEALKGALDIKGIFTTKVNDTIDKAAALEVKDGAVLDVKGGTITINDNDTIKGTLLSSAYDENSKLTLESINDNNKERGNIQIKLGKVDIKNSIINLITRNSKVDTIEKGAGVNILAGSKVSAGSGTSMTLNNAADETNDTWEGTIELDGGTITLDNVSNHTGNIKTTVNGGTLNIQGDKTTLIAGDVINKEAIINIAKNNVLNIEGAKVVLSDNDNWNEAKVTAASGTLDLDNINQNGALDIQGADLNIINSSITIKEDDIIDGTKSIVDFDDDSKIDIKAGSVILDNNDKRNGMLILDGENANLTFVNVKPIKVPGGGPDKPVGSLTTNAGTLTFNNCDILVDGDIQIGIGTGLVATGSSLTVTDKGVLSLANNSEIDDASKIYLVSEDPDGEGGTLNYGGTGATLKLDAEKGNLNLLNGAKLALSGTGGSARVENQVVVDVQENAELKIENGFELKLDGDPDNPNRSDKWNGKLVNENSVATISSIENSPTASLIQSKIGDDPDTAVANTAITNITAQSDIKLGIDSSIDSGTVNITDNSKLTVMDGSIIKGGDFNIDSTSEFSSLSNGLKIDNMKLSGTVSAMNNSIETYEIENMFIGAPASSDTPSDNIGDLTLDLFARSNTLKDSDKFIVGNVQNASDESTAILNLKEWNLAGDVYGYGAPLDRHISFGNFLKYEAGDDIELQVNAKEVFTPIGYYRLNRASEGGYSLDLASYNKQVFRGAITTLAQWENQLAINDILFNHSMLMPDYESDFRRSSLVNKISAISPQFAPYQYSKKDGAIWYRAYGNFENLQMSNHVRVGNNSWGVLIGTDLGLRDFKKGWKYMPTVYLGYNAAHQSFSGAGATQQGGQVGYLGTLYKNNTIIASLIYGGIYGNYMDVYNTTDSTFNYFGGVAFKAAQNFRYGKMKNWILQPNLLASYNYFGEQNWYSNFGQMDMTTGMLNGVNIAPGVNLIWQKEAFSAYLTLQYMFNANGAVEATAGNVDLSNMSMQRGYIQYGIGFTRTFTDRISGFFQSVLRNAGRTGVGFMAGVDIVLGKDPKKIKK